MRAETHALNHSLNPVAASDDSHEVMVPRPGLASCRAHACRGRWVKLCAVHEVALSTQLARVVNRAAHGKKVTDVHLEIGALRQVVPESLMYAWQFVVKGTPLDGVQLNVDWIPLVIRCDQGHITTVKEELNLMCPKCGKTTNIMSGKEFTVVDIEVES